MGLSTRRGTETHPSGKADPECLYRKLFNGKLRDECLNEHWFHSLDHARAILCQRRQDYNEQRPHSTLGYKTPAEMAEKLRDQ
jgi:putative transposase